MAVRTDRHLAHNYKSISTMQHFLTRAFRLPALFATLVGATLCGQALAQAPQSLSTLMYFDGVSSQGGLVTDGVGFYGATAGGGYAAPGGLLYRLALNPSSVTTIYEYGRLDVWTGANPAAGLLLSSDGNFYGVTQNNSIDVLRGGVPIGTGTIFRVARDGTGYTKLFDFQPIAGDSRRYPVNTTGEPPQAALIEGVESGGVRYLYGTTIQGGRDGTGTVFKIRPDGSGYQVLHHFGAPRLKVPAESTLDFDFNADARLKNDDGVNPNQRLLLTNDGYLYGVTTSGGDNGTGVVFRISVNADGNVLAPYDPAIKSFAHFAPTPVTITDPADTASYGKLKTNTTGGYPAGGLVLADGMLYGTTQGLGGSYTIPADPTTTPPTPPIVTSYGYGGGYGTVFRINPTGPLTTTGSIQVVRAFTGSETTLPVGVISTPGNAPSGDLIVATDGMLVGTTQSGGIVPDHTGAGTVFKMSLDGVTHVQECVFTQTHAGVHGATPISGVIQGADGGFFGIAYQGGYGNGVIFKCGTPYGDPPLGIRPPYEDDGGGALPLWMIVVMGTLLAVQAARRRRRTP